ncbi:MAG: amino acid ABC transporter permease [Ruminococcaceae bacterium]|nr:amino acid ABC transporter permease [Oscillospiraceae bacterium]
MQLFIKVTMSLLEGLGTTLKIFSLTLLMALPLGLLISLGAMSKFKIIKIPLKMLIWVIRGTPLMLQLIIFGLGPGLMGIMGMDMFLAVIIAFVLNYACYFAEIFRGGIESIPKGQYEAGTVLGYTKMQIFIRIILPQVIKRIIPPMGNEFLTLIKDTSLANTIMIYEITWNAKRMMNSEHILWPLFYSGLFYLILCGIVTVIFNYIEKKLDYYQ